MPKTDIIPCTKEEMDRLVEASIDNDFYYMIFTTARITGRRLGELYGSQKKKEVGRKVIGKKVEYDEQGNPVALARTRAIYKKIPGEWEGGIKVKDVNLEEGVMKVWVLKRKKLMQDETILTPEVRKTIKHYIIRNKLNPEDYLFREKSYRSIQEAVIRYSKKAKIEHKVSFHNFRHYLVTELKRLGYPNDKIAKVTGHKTPSVLTIYDHVVASDLKEELNEDLKKI